MKPLQAQTAAVLVVAIFTQGCASFSDDAFAHGVKSGNSRAAVASMQPGQARLHIYERDGRWYYPIQYTIARGDAVSTFALIRNGSPTTLDGRSLAYNAARANQASLASQLLDAGYGDSGDIAQAAADNRRERQQGNAFALAGLGILALLALTSSSSSSDSAELTPSERAEQNYLDSREQSGFQP